ncbi:TPA: putative holin [Providencia alcalifaciens]
MNEPLTGTATVSLAGVSIVGLFSGMDAGVVIGSFAGAVIFVLSVHDIRLLKRWAYFGVAFIVGIYGAEFMSSLLSDMTGGRDVDKAVGAMFSSAGLVGVLVSISKPGAMTDAINGFINNLIDKFRGGGK